MAITKEQRIGFYPNQDFKTKQPKPGMSSVKLTAENITYLQGLKVGARLSLYDNQFLAENERAPHMHLLIPSGDAPDYSKPRPSNADGPRVPKPMSTRVTTPEDDF